MADVKAIELKGIVHNTTKIGVQDGQAEDIVNLRFKDGSWRSTGDGKELTVNATYENIYIHTNVYRHLLGVKNGKLWWFANASESDPNAFTAITPVALCDVVGDVTITQTGHLITIIDKSDNFALFVFKYDDDGVGFYKAVTLDENGRSNEKSIFPFGRFNISLGKSERFNAKAETDLGGSELWQGFNDIHMANLRKAIDIATARDLCIKARSLSTENNKFSQPFLAALAVELYDGSLAFVTNPVLISPVDFNMTDSVDNYTRVYHGVKYCDSPNGYKALRNTGGILPYDKKRICDISITDQYTSTTFDGFQTVSCGGFSYRTQVGSNVAVYSSEPFTAAAVGYDLRLTIEDVSIIKDNPDIFSAICLFVSPEVDTLNFNGMENTKTDDEWDDAFAVNKMSEDLDSSKACVLNISTYIPRIERSVIKSRLLSSPLFLFHRFGKEEIGAFEDNVAVDVNANKDEYPGLLKNIATQSVRLSDASGSRMTYIPSYAYNYNGRLHIANYKATQWHGFPIYNYLNFKTSRSPVPTQGYRSSGIGDWLIQNNKPIAYVKTKIKTERSAGLQVVVRYADADYTESWYSDIGTCIYNPLIGFNDYRATEMTIYFVHAVSTDKIELYKDIFTLKPECTNGLNLSYYLHNTLAPFTPTKIAEYTFSQIQENPSLLENVPDESNVVETYPNAIKVSSTDNPMYFPVANTYQIGSSEIVAMCSNAVAVGTGQTGDAPLYVFCKDGVYALFVDSTGQMTYTNARVIARDVCNNSKSVTPIDDGVVFTTDRGLMMIAGSEVVEIGQPLEGDYKKFSVVGNVDYNTIAKNSYYLDQLSGIAADTVTDCDFLTYLKNAIVAYNHNERELMISNPNKKYSYVLDREGNWTRRDYSADEYVENYPVTYRLSSGKLIQVDEDSDGDNGIFAMSNVLKLDSIGFKSVDRLVARGYFETIEKTTNAPYIGIYVFGSYDARKWACLGHNEKKGKFTDLGCNVERTDCKFFRFLIAGQLTKNSRLDYFEVSEKQSRLSTKIR